MTKKNQKEADSLVLSEGFEGELPPSEPETTHLDQIKLRIDSLSNSIVQVQKEKETHRLDVEERFQQTHKQLKAEWVEIKRNFDMRLDALQQELLKSQGVYEYLHNLEQADGNSPT